MNNYDKAIEPDSDLDNFDENESDSISSEDTIDSSSESDSE